MADTLSLNALILHADKRLLFGTEQISHSEQTLSEAMTEVNRGQVCSAACRGLTPGLTEAFLRSIMCSVCVGYRALAHGRLFTQPRDSRVRGNVFF